MLSGWYDSAGLLVPDGVLQLGKKLQQAWIGLRPLELEEQVVCRDDSFQLFHPRASFWLAVQRCRLVLDTILDLRIFQRACVHQLNYDLTGIVCAYLGPYGEVPSAGPFRILLIAKISSPRFRDNWFPTFGHEHKESAFLVPTTVASLEGRKAWFAWRHLTVIVDGSIRQPFICGGG
jgi:hypothetical protein